MAWRTELEPVEDDAEVSTPSAMSLPSRLVVDCRWWGLGGAGRVTEWFIRGRARLQAPRGLQLWGPQGLQPHLWTGASLHLSQESPLAWAGQKEWFKIPDGDGFLFFHQIRPLRPINAVTFIHDTISLRFGRGARAKKAYLKLVAARSRRILTGSNFARQQLITELDIAPSKIRVLRYPADDGMAGRVEALRSTLPQQPIILYVGRYADHKNLPALMEAFARSEFKRKGGRLVLAGGSAEETRYLRNRSGSLDQVHMLGLRSQDELEHLYGTCAAVVMPSLEEGFGLPAWEAMICGIPVSISDAPALREATMDLVPSFPSDSISEMTKALDRVTNDEEKAVAQERREVAVARAPDLQTFAEQVLALVEEAL